MTRAMPPPDWMDHAACIGNHSGDWFPEGDTATEQSVRAKRICNVCVVRSECLEFALTEHIKFGIWGGMGYKERRKYRRRLHLEAAS